MLIKASATAIPLKENSVQCVVTSPPYWGLRKYSGEQELVWPVPASRGVVRCNNGDHLWVDGVKHRSSGGPQVPQTKWANNAAVMDGQRDTVHGTCSLCGAWRGAFGLEPTIGAYLEHSVQILREVRRVLRPDGVCFWNIGDSRANDTKWGGKSGGKNYTSAAGGYTGQREKRNTGLKPKDLCLLPFRVALAAQDDGWFVRSDICWIKNNPMPESVTDRPADSFEHIFMFTKNQNYFWNAEAVKELTSGTAHARGGGVNPKAKMAGKNSRVYRDRDAKHPSRPKQNPSFSGAVSGLVEYRNMRNVWEFGTQPYEGSHFATFPEELVIRCLQAATRQSDLVLDPFAGSGTVGEVAFNMGRKFVLCDLAYQDLQRERIPPMAFVDGFQCSTCTTTDH